MVQDHPVLIKPDNTNESIWRYMDLSKYISILDRKSLFFSRADKLGDPFEGSYSKIEVLKRFSPIQHISKKAQQIHQNSMKKYSEYTKWWPKFVAVNCWHMNPHESAAMWNLYLKSNEGIAIKSTYKKLKDSIEHDQDKIFMGLVNYVDYSTDPFSSSHPLAPFAHKRKSFEHEKEVRCIILRYPDNTKEETWNENPPPTIEKGIEVSVHVNQLISDVYVAPDSPPWFQSIIKSVTRNFGFDFNVIKSKLDENPVY